MYLAWRDIVIVNLCCKLAWLSLPGNKLIEAKKLEIDRSLLCSQPSLISIAAESRYR